MPKIKRAYTRFYRDTRKTIAYVDWEDGSHTEGGPCENYHGVMVPIGAHMGALFDRAIREGKTIERETW